MDRDTVVYWDVRRETWCRRHPHAGGGEILEYLDGSQELRPRVAVERDVAAGRLVPNPNADPPFDDETRRD
jgi:hypothetical protein